MFSSLLNPGDSNGINLAARLGEPGQAVSRGLESSTASLINRVAARSSDRTYLRRIFCLANEEPSDVNVFHQLNGRSIISHGSRSRPTKKLVSVASGRNHVFDSRCSSHDADDAEVMQ